MLAMQMEKDQTQASNEDDAPKPLDAAEAERLSRLVEPMELIFEDPDRAHSVDGTVHFRADRSDLSKHNFKYYIQGYGTFFITYKDTNNENYSTYFVEMSRKKGSLGFVQDKNPIIAEVNIAQILANIRAYMIQRDLEIIKTVIIDPDDPNDTIDRYNKAKVFFVDDLAEVF